MRSLLTLTGISILLTLFTYQCEDLFKTAIEIQTGIILDQSFTTATVEGTIIEFGKGISEYGHCWSLSLNPTYEATTRTAFGERKATGAFRSELGELSPGTTYFIRAYAINHNDEVVYGDNLEITTLSLDIPTLETSPISAITPNSASSGGNIVDDGGAPITARGVCWNTTENPTTSNSFTADGNGIGSYTSEITDLECNTAYFVRAYATNSVGTSYGSQVSFNTIECPVTVPTVTTNSISDITTTSAQGGGNVISDGGSPLIAKGICWSTSTEPTTGNNITNDGAGTGSYTSALVGLSCGTTYYIRAYATNSEGTSYGNEVNFTTAACATVPSVLTSSISNISETSATGGGDVISDGGADVFDRGVCWNTSEDPTLSDNKSQDGGGTGSYASSLTDLVCGTIYYVRAYATNSAGTSYGQQVSFSTSECTTVTDIDGNVYQTVQIGVQTWMAENLKVTRFADGSAISLVESTSGWDGVGYSDKAYCWYDNSNANRDIYGGLYTWAAAMNGAGSSSSNPSGIQGICPDGWHLPSDSEWKELEMYLGMSQATADLQGWRGLDEGCKLKETGIAHWDSPNTGATNSSGFSALPAGIRTYNGSFGAINSRTYIWSATENSLETAWYRRLEYNNADVQRHDYRKDYGYSVRCVKD